ncbi:hypothetical protein Y032_0074g907 [Ancylostoma ceylanicum]|nr:hypothetical protein Y032_0074g907 [Ancylostoma ceylanicum]
MNIVDWISSIFTKRYFPSHYAEGPTLNFASGDHRNYLDFQYLIRSNVTELAWASLYCSDGSSELMMIVCFTNQSPPKFGDPIYEVGTGVCSGCPQGTFCEAGSKLCARTLSAPPGETIFKGWLPSEREVLQVFFVIYLMHMVDNSAEEAQCERVDDNRAMISAMLT